MEQNVLSSNNGNNNVIVIVYRCKSFDVQQYDTVTTMNNNIMIDFTME